MSRFQIFGQDDGGRIVATPDGFHMWVHTETHIIDFMAPIFPKSFAELPASVPRKMFQRFRTTEAESLDAMAAAGDFFTLPEPGLTETLLGAFLDRPTMTDLLMVAERWFGGRRKPQKASIQMQNDLGEVSKLKLPPLLAIGSW